ncbi:DMT family transporter [Actinoallomurus bryophytorum]|uniref:Putative membrane protein n=1 Tax=Actinoallomurus bryophytorum TaxID=1490222 RepID=A0A543CK43_9ACTN|nr:DMT family transporter [Actinoallomurus bryophytorum]TQL97472.1 putative membrane protein [Actinoallomurus bryophytorum]
MIITLALASAIVFGAGDFCGGAASRRGGSTPVLMFSLPTGLGLLLIVAVGLGGTTHPGALAWGAASGLAGGGGMLMFYRALAEGPMSVVAPVSGLMAAVLPAAVGVARGDRLSLTAYAGIGLCLVAICFVSVEKSAGRVRRRMSGPVLAVLAGMGFGAFFVLIKQGDDGTLWPLAASKAVGVLMVVAAAAVSGRGPAALLRDRVTIGIAMLAGSLDVLGNALYVLAARAGMLSVAGVLSSLYPASTVLLARVVYGERLRPIQRVGLAIAVAGVGLVTSG